MANSIFDLAVAVAGKAALWGWLRTWRSRLPAPSLKYLSVPLRPQTLPRTRKRENYMLRFADLAEINPPTEGAAGDAKADSARLSVSWERPVSRRAHCADTGAILLPGRSWETPSCPSWGWQRARPIP